MDVAHIERAVQEKKPVPEIDFTLHTMEDGSQVNTQERVCKGNRHGKRKDPTIDTSQMCKHQHFTPQRKISSPRRMIAQSQTSSS